MPCPRHNKVQWSPDPDSSRDSHRSPFRGPAVGVRLFPESLPNCIGYNWNSCYSKTDLSFLLLKFSEAVLLSVLPSSRPSAQLWNAAHLLPGAPAGSHSKQDFGGCCGWALDKGRGTTSLAGTPFPLPYLWAGLASVLHLDGCWLVTQHSKVQTANSQRI